MATSDYFVFRHALQVWRMRIVQAVIEGEPPVPEPHWWDCLPLGSLPLLTFALKKNMPLLDNMFTGTIFDLYSTTLITHLSEAGVRFETFPVRVIDASTRKSVKAKYKIFHLLERYPALDKKLSDIDDESGDIRKLVLSKRYLQSKQPLFRLKGAEDVVLIHQELKDLLESHNITGCKYIPIDEYQTGIDSYFDQLDNEEK